MDTAASQSVSSVACFGYLFCRDLNLYAFYPVFAIKHDQVDLSDHNDFFFWETMAYLWFVEYYEFELKSYKIEKVRLYAHQILGNAESLT